jgi:Gram-negative bacterial TonB protein C-terminal
MARDRELNAGLAGADGTTSAPSWWKWGAHKLEPLLVSAALAVSLHTVLFSVPIRGQSTSKALGQPSSTPNAAHSNVVRARTIDTWNATNASHGSEEVVLAFDPRNKLVDASLATQHFDHDRKIPIGVEDSRVSPPANGPVLRVPGLLGDEDFFSRDSLDVGPSPATPVLIDYPSIPGVGGTHVGLLTLFIDEMGRVLKVRVDSQALPAEMQDAARSAFMHAAFAPGLVDGLPVRSRIRVEVVFESSMPTR